MRYYMPTIVLEEDNVVKNHPELFNCYGKKALIVTGRNSARINGALGDVTDVLDKEGIEWLLYDKIVENPPFEQVIEGAEFGKSCDFVIGIGGGSPIDAAKGMAILIKNPTTEPFDMLYKTKGSPALPLLAIPTTGGTGTETTPYAVYTDHNLKTKTSMTQRVFPEYALLDVKYYMFMPRDIRNSTSVDALTHSIEGYMNTNATKYSDYIALESIRIWGQVKDALKEEEMSVDHMRTFMTASTLAGMVISQTGTSIAHSMGYPLTYNHGLAHGKANGVFMAQYLNLCSNKEKVSKILGALGLSTTADLDQYLESVIGKYEITEEEIQTFSDMLMSNARKLKNHPDPVSRDDVVRCYRLSVGASN